LISEEDSSNAFIARDLQRISDRASLHEDALKGREKVLASGIDDKERDIMREQLVNYRRLCRSDDAKANVDIRVLQSNMDNAKARANNQVNISSREVAR
jgi:hypothetical protein